MDTANGIKQIKLFFNGWNSDKVILGDNKSKEKHILKHRQKNTVASANDMYVNDVSTNQYINDTCNDDE
jgi:hypothetical protein